MINIEARDILAAIVLLGGFWLMRAGIDSIVGGMMIAVTVYYFRKKTEKPAQ